MTLGRSKSSGQYVFFLFEIRYTVPMLNPAHSVDAAQHVTVNPEHAGPALIDFLAPGLTLHKLRITAVAPTLLTRQCPHHGETTPLNLLQKLMFDDLESTTINRREGQPVHEKLDHILGLYTPKTW